MKRGAAALFYQENRKYFLPMRSRTMAGGTILLKIRYRVAG
jgi:hypothetical protein